MVKASVDSLIDLTDDFEWAADIFNSPFPPSRGPIFLIDLELHDDGPAYSSSITEYEKTLVNCFNKGINVTNVSL